MIKNKALDNNALQPSPATAEDILDIAYRCQRIKRFLAAWKKAIQSVGETYFKPSAKVEEATAISQLPPDLEMIEHALLRINIRHAIFLAVLCSFYDSAIGQNYLEQLGYLNIATVAALLDPEHLDIMAELFINYHGWPP